MWDMIPSLRPFVDALAPAFTQPSFATSCHLLLAWLMCLGKHTLRRPQSSPDGYGLRIQDIHQQRDAVAGLQPRARPDEPHLP